MNTQVIPYLPKSIKGKNKGEADVIKVCNLSAQLFPL